MKKFFIHIPKNAGMTIRKSPTLAGKFDVATPNNHYSAQYTTAVKRTMDALGDHHGYEHARWRDLSDNIKNNYRCFAVIRNPWDRVVSRYFFAKKVIEVENKVPNNYADISSFEAFLEERHKWGGKQYMWHRAIRGWFPAFDHVCDHHQNVQADMIRFEHLNQDLAKFFNVAQIGRPRNVTNLNTQTYKQIYTDQTIQIVADWYAKDIEYWGYDFDAGPTRNYWRNDVKQS